MEVSKSEFIYLKHEVRPRNICGRTQITINLVLGTVLGSIHGCIVWRNSSSYVRNRRPAILLNHVSKYGGMTARAAGILTLMYTGFGTALTKWRGVDDEANTVLSSVASGYLYHCTRGFHSMLLSGALGLTIGMGIAVHNSGIHLILFWKELIADFVKGNTFTTEEIQNN